MNHCFGDVGMSDHASADLSVRCFGVWRCDRAWETTSQICVVEAVS
ncbi:MAG: hypothetical protein ACK6A9_14175 [Dolichospermum sp.]|nr:hypothetical protein [Anabaena sp. 49628_E55]